MTDGRLKRMRTRRFLSIALALLLALGCAPLRAARAEEGGWRNILLLGGDARDMRKYDRSDSMILLSLNRDEGRAKLTSIMRDTWVRFPGTKRSGKINAATVYGGPELAVATVGEAFGADVRDYAIVNMEDLVQIIDLLGGVDLEITEAERQETNVYAANYTGAAYSGAKSLPESGRVHMNGLLAMSYCRLRYIDSDYERVLRQQRVLLAMAERAQAMELDALMAAADEIAGIVRTSLSADELRALAKEMMIVDVGAVEGFRIPADGTFDSGIRDGVWRIDADLARNAELLREFIYGD